MALLGGEEQGPSLGTALVNQPRRAGLVCRTVDQQSLWCTFFLVTVWWFVLVPFCLFVFFLGVVFCFQTFGDFVVVLGFWSFFFFFSLENASGSFSGEQ